MRNPGSWEAFNHFRSKIRLRLRRWRSWRGEAPRDEEVDFATAIQGAEPEDVIGPPIWAEAAEVPETLRDESLPRRAG